MDVYIGNLAADATEADLKKLFGLFGKVDSAKIMQDRHTGKPRDAAMVEMPSDVEALAAIDGLDGKTVKGQPITVSKRPLTRSR